MEKRWKSRMPAFGRRNEKIDTGTTEGAEGMTIEIETEGDDDLDPETDILDLDLETDIPADDLIGTEVDPDPGLEIEDVTDTKNFCQICFFTSKFVFWIKIVISHVKNYFLVT